MKYESDALFPTITILDDLSVRYERKSLDLEYQNRKDSEKKVQGFKNGAHVADKHKRTIIRNYIVRILHKAVCVLLPGMYAL